LKQLWLLEGEFTIWAGELYSSTGENFFDSVVLPHVVAAVAIDPLVD